MHVRDFGSKMQQIARKTAPDWKTKQKKILQKYTLRSTLYVALTTDPGPHEHAIQHPQDSKCRWCSGIAWWIHLRHIHFHENVLKPMKSSKTSVFPSHFPLTVTPALQPCTLDLCQQLLLLVLLAQYPAPGKHLLQQLDVEVAVVEDVQHGVLGVFVDTKRELNHLCFCLAWPRPLSGSGPVSCYHYGEFWLWMFEEENANSSTFSNIQIIAWLTSFLGHDFEGKASPPSSELKPVLGIMDLLLQWSSCMWAQWL